MENTVTVKMTSEQANLLACYILMTTQHRKSEAEAWRNLAAERKEDGTPRFPNAKGNAEYYESLEERLEEIRSLLDNAR